MAKIEKVVCATYELDMAKQLPAWHRVKVWAPSGSRALTPHEICLLREVFDIAMAASDDELRADFFRLSETMGLVRNSEHA